MQDGRQKGSRGGLSMALAGALSLDLSLCSKGAGVSGISGYVMGGTLCRKSWGPSQSWARVGVRADKALCPPVQDGL